MEQKAKRNVVGRVARVEFCHCGDSIVLTVGAVSLRLDVLVAEDVAATIACALSLETPPRVSVAGAPSGGEGSQAEFSPTGDKIN